MKREDGKSQRWLFAAQHDQYYGDFLIEFQFICDIYIILILVYYYQYTVK